MKQGQKTTGHPVDVATGTVYSTSNDILISGAFPLTWSRRYSTALLSRPDNVMGPGWTSQYFASLTRINDGYLVITPEGEEELFEDKDKVVESGGVIHNLSSFEELTRNSDHYVLTRWNVGSGAINRLFFQANEHNRPGLLVKIDDASGHGLDIFHDKSGLVTKVQQRLEGRTLQFTYSMDRRLKSVTFCSVKSHCQEQVWYEYDRYGRLAVATNAQNYSTCYEYDKSGRLVCEKLRDGGEFIFKYDQNGRCVLTTGPAGYYSKKFKYLDNICMTEVTNSLGHSSQYEWRPDGQVVRELDPMGRETLYSYDDSGRIVAIAKPAGGTLKYDYDENGNRSKVTNALGRSVKYIFNEQHQLLRQSDNSGACWTRTYDNFGRLSSVTNPLGLTFKLAYDNIGNCIGVSDNRGHIQSRAYTSPGVLKSISDAVGNRTVYKIDEKGRVRCIVDAQGGRTEYCYDVLDQITKVIFPDGSSVKCIYDAGGNVTSITDRNGNTSQYRYGPCSRLLESRGPMDETLNYEWGTEPNQLIRIKNAIGEIYEIEYDKSGLIEKEKGFDSREISFKYDNAGNRIMTTNGCGEVIKYEYNDAGLMTRQILPDGSEAEFKYDALGNVIQARNDHCTIALERDMLGRVTKETQNNIFIKRYYDIAGNRKSLESSVGDQFYYEYDTNNMLTELIINKEYKMHFEYDERGFEVCRNLPGYIAVVQDRDIMGRLNSQTVKKQYNHEPLTPNESIGPIISRKYEYVNSKLQAVNDTLRGTTRYIYDPLDRIISMEANNFRETFKYNKINALVEKTINENKYTLAFAKSGQVQSDGNSRYSYDDHGRLISCIKGDGTDYQSESHFRWNGLDQLVEARISDGEIWRYKYDPFGRRIEKSGNGRVINYIWDEDVIIHEIEVADKPLVTTWVFDVQSFRPLGKVNKKGCYSIVTDQRNIPLEMIDKYGNIVWAAEFFAWGTQAKSYSSESNCPIRFHGQWFDVETGFHYNLFRYYDPSIGRYICQDPIGLHGGMDLYGYARNPIEYCDPYGLQPPNVGDIHPQTGNEILASQEYGSPGDFMVEAAKPSMRGRLVQTHLYEDPGHHNPHGGINPYNPNKSVLPPNHIELFNSSIVHDGNRYAMDAHGNIHQFQPSTRGQHPVFHWAGQENGRTASGRPVSLVVPREARRKLMAQCEPDDG